jgi:hypothetical protein
VQALSFTPEAQSYLFSRKKARFLPFLEHSLPLYTYRTARNTVHQNKPQISLKTSIHHLRISISTHLDCRLSPRITCVMFCGPQIICADLTSASTDYNRLYLGIVYNRWLHSFHRILIRFTETSKLTRCSTLYTNPQDVSPHNTCCKSPKHSKLNSGVP